MRLDFCDKVFYLPLYLFLVAGLGGGLGVPLTVNPLYDGLRTLARRQRSLGFLSPLTVTIRPFRLAVMKLLS